MADGEERLGLGFDVDSSGLNRAERESIAFLDRLAAALRTTNAALPPLTVDTDQLRRNLEGAGENVGRVFREIRETAATELAGIEEAVQGMRAAPPEIDVSQLRANIEGVGAEIGDFFSGVRAQVNSDLSAIEAAVGTVTLPPIVLPPPTPPPPPDFSEWIIAADRVRAEFDTMLSTARLSQQASSAAQAGADALATGFLSRLGEVRDVVATGLISPGEGTRQADRLLEEFSRAVLSHPVPPIVIPPALPPEPPDFSEWIRAADIVREEFEQMLDTPTLTTEARIASQAAASELQAGFLEKLGTIRDEISHGLVDRRSGVLAADALLESFSREIATKQGQIPPIEVQARVRRVQSSGQTDNGIITEAEFRESDRAYDALFSAQEKVARGGKHVAEGMELSRTQSNLLRNSFVALATQAAGVPGPLGRIVDVGIQIGYGTTGVLAAAAATALLIQAHRFLTTASREAREEQEKLVTALNREADQATPAAVRAVQGITAAIESQARARRDLARAELLGGDANQKGFSLSPIEDEFARRAQQRQEAGRRAEAQAQVDATAAVREFQALNVRTLTESITLHQANAEQIRRAQGFLPILLQQEQDINRPLSERLELHRQLLALQAAINDTAAQQASRARSEQRTGDDLADAKQAFAAEEEALRASLSLEEITRQEFARRRVDLAERTAAAEIAALQSQVLRAAVAPANTPADRIARDAQIEHLNREIERRERILAQQEQQIINEGRIADQAILERAGLGNAGGVSGVQAPAFLDQHIELEPQIDMSEVEAALDQFNRDTKRFAFEDAFERGRRAGIALLPILNSINLSLEDIGNANVNTPPLLTLEQEIDNVLGGIGQIAQEAEAFGIIGEQAGAQIDAVLQLGDAISNVMESASTGNILGLVASGIGLLGSIFGGGESEHDRVVRENTEAIERNTADREQRFSGLGGEAEAASTIGEVTSKRRAEEQAIIEANRGKSVFEGGGSNGFVSSLEDRFKALGISVGDLQKIAEEHGIDILDKKGRLVSDALEQLRTEILANIQAQLRWQDTLDEQTQAIELRARLEGREVKPEDRLGTDLEAARKLGAGATVDRFFGGVDLNNAEQVRRASLAMLDAFENGQLSAEELGRLTREDLIAILEDSAAHLDTFGNSVEEATRKLQNVPDFFNLAEAEFAARGDPALDPTQGLPPNRPGDGSSLPPFPPSIDPQPLDRPPLTLPDSERFSEPINERLVALGGGASLRDLLDALRSGVAGGAGSINNYFTGDVVIPGGAAGNESPEALARRIRDAQVTLGSASSSRADLQSL